MRRSRPTRPVFRRGMHVALVVLALTAIGLSACGEVRFDPDTGQFSIPLGKDGPSGH